MNKLVAVLATAVLVLTILTSSVYAEGGGEAILNSASVDLYSLQIPFLENGGDAARNITSGDQTSSKTIYVDDDFIDDPVNHKWNTIQKGVNDATAGDTIFVYDGLYIENIEIANDLLTLTTESKDAIVDGGWSGSCFYVTGDSITISGFTIQNSGGGSSGVYLRGSSGSEIMGNDILNNGWGVFLYSCEHNTIKNNYIADSNLAGIYLYWYNDYNTVVDNIVTRNDNGIYLNDYSDYNTIENNSVDSNKGYGIWLDENNYNTIKGNTVNSNENRGIYLHYEGNSQIINNTVTSNKDVGIYLYGSPDNMIKGNSLDLNHGGLYLYSNSKNCEIMENTIAHSTEYGLYLRSGSSLNEIYHNNFIHNFKQAEEYESSNSFDYDPAIGGNYWSDHNCTGNPSDGSQPYTIPPYDHKDRYPFEDINGWLTTMPDLVIVEKWLCWPDNCTICYNVTNIGNKAAPACHNATLYVDGEVVAQDHVPVDLAPGESYIGCFEDYTWTYTPPGDNITVCADNNDTLNESDETNNCLTNIWICGDVNRDGKVTMSDVRKVFNRYLNPNYPLDLPWAADVNCDGKVTMSDVRKVFNRYLNPSYDLNCCCEEIR